MPKKSMPKPIDLNEEQQAVVRTRAGYWKTEAGPGSGKCLGRGTPVILMDGEIIPVEEVSVGDRLLGPDGNPRLVLSTTNGIDNLYKIIPIKGDSWVCNKEHMLSIKISGEEACKKYMSYHEISVTDYLNKKHKSFRQKAKLWRPTEIFFPESKVPIDPYFVGVWLGDGSSDLSTLQITKPDVEISDLCEKISNDWGLEKKNRENSSGCPTYSLSSGSAKDKPKIGRNPLLTEMQNLFPNGKEIPKQYLVNSSEIRRQILAGLLDTDGYCFRGQFEISSKFRNLAQDILFCARSLGLAAYQSIKKVDVNGRGDIRDYYRITISGDLDLIPTRIPRKKALKRKQIKSVLRTGFSVESIGVGEYFGFELEGDGLFLLGDFTVTHNTACIVARYASLLQEGVSPDDILSLSFASTAAKNLRDRVESLVGKITENRIAGARTFHSLSLAFAQEERDEFPFTLSENVLAPEPVAYKIAAEAGRRFEVDPRSLRAEISLWKRSRVSATQAIKDCEAGGVAEAKKLKLALAYKEYDKRLKENGILDFDSIIYWAVQLMDLKPEVRKRWIRSWVQIDEAQDLSKIEWDLVKLISGPSVLAVGDLSQNLYSFRGSDSRLFRDMEEMFPGTQTLFLGRNYRSSPEIVEYIRPLAVSQDLATRFHTTNESGPKPEVKGFLNSLDEALWVAKRIKETYERR